MLGKDAGQECSAQECFGNVRRDENMQERGPGVRESRLTVVAMLSTGRIDEW